MLEEGLGLFEADGPRACGHLQFICALTLVALCFADCGRENIIQRTKRQPRTRPFGRLAVAIFSQVPTPQRVTLSQTFIITLSLHLF